MGGSLPLSLLTGGGGVVGLIRAVLRAVEELVKHAQGPGRQQQSSLAPKTGAVWSACEQVERLPKSNKVAYRRALLQVRPTGGRTAPPNRRRLAGYDQDEQAD